MTSGKKKHSTTDKITDFFEEVVSEIFEERKELYAAHIKSRIESETAVSMAGAAAQSHQAAWQEIDSLSRLRSIVGGRFENLKSKWLAAGFPLKESKSTRSEPFTLNQAGWLELSMWISNQGFDVRLNPDKKEILFEIKSA